MKSLNPKLFLRHQRNYFLRARLEHHVEPEPWRLRIIHPPYPFYGVVLFLLLGEPTYHEKPIAESILNKDSLRVKIVEGNLYLMLYLQAPFWEALFAAAISKFSELAPREIINSPMFIRWLESVEVVQSDQSYYKRTMRYSEDERCDEL
ncbi:MAG: hypothetical protein ACK2UK_03730 [Candidatus Promineifilaceae bacterium]